MGGMTLPIYVIHSNRSKRPHGLHQAILLSPAGIHTRERVTSYMHYIGLFFYYLLPMVCDHVALPDFAISLSQKLQQDFTTAPATRDLMNFLASLILGGSSTGQNGTFVQSARMVNSVLSFGFSTDLAKQFFQQYLY